MDVVKIPAKGRDNVGTKWSKSVRREGLIPCVLYGGDEVYHFTVSHHDVKPLVYTDQFKLADVELNGHSHRCILKTLQMHPLTDQVTHIDFLMLVEGKAIKLDIPIRFNGVSPGVKNGGLFIDKLRTIKVKLLPKNLISEVFVDISELKLGDTVRVKDVLANEGVEILSPSNIPIASVVVPRALIDAELDEEEEGEEETGESDEEKVAEESTSE